MSRSRSQPPSSPPSPRDAARRPLGALRGAVAQARVLGATWVVLLVIGYASGRIVSAEHPGFDASLLADLRGASHGGLTDAMRAITAAGSTAVLDAVFLLAVAALAARRHWRGIGFLLLASPGTVVLVQLLKQAVDRARPAGPHLTAAEGPSWPSGHASGALALYGGLLILVCSLDAGALGRLRGARILAVCVTLALVALVGVSRVYLGVHYPTDVLCSWLLASAWLAALRRAISPLTRDRPRR